MTTTITKSEYIQMYEIVGAAMEVHGEVGRGLEEHIYQEMLAMELDNRNIPYEREKMLHIYYKGKELKKKYFADFYINDVVVELKAVSEICREHRAQLFNYMRITKQKRGILFNFGEDSLHTERYIFQQELNEFVLINKENLHLFVEKD